MVENIKAFFKPNLIVLYLYIILSFIAKPPIMSDVYVTYSIYMLIGYSLFVIVWKRTIYWSKYLTWSISIIALCFISIMYAHHKEVAYNGLYTLFIPFILSFSIVQLISTKEDIKNILFVLALSGGILYILMMHHGLFLIVNDRLGNEFSGNANAFSGMVLLSVLAAICNIYMFKNKLIWMLMIAIIIADYHMLILSEGRKYLITPILFWGILQFKISDFKFNRLILYIILTAIALPIIVTLLLDAEILSESLIKRFEMTTAIMGGSKANVGDGDIERRAMVIQGLSYFLNSPIWGNGQCNFSYLFSLDWSGGHLGLYSHNNYVELLCNLGVIGFVVYYRFYYKILKLSFRRNNPYDNWSFAFIISLMIMEFGIVSYYTQYLLQILIFIASLSVFERQKVRF